MTIPTDISDGLNALASAFNDAAPLANAGRDTVLALRGQAEALVETIDMEVTAGGAALDNYTLPLYSSLYADSFLTLLGQCEDQQTEAEMRGYVGRVTSNLNLLPVA